MSEPSTELLPCPFCGTTSPHFMRSGHCSCFRCGHARWSDRPLENVLKKKINRLGDAVKGYEKLVNIKNDELDQLRSNRWARFSDSELIHLKPGGQVWSKVDGTTTPCDTCATMSTEIEAELTRRAATKEGLK